MLLAVVLAGVGIGIVLLGAKGFSEEGIPLTYDRSLCGAPGRCVGIVCLLLGSPMVLLAVLLLLVGAGRN
jgi:hypothetical protein